MRTIYIDGNFICHADYADGRAAVETDALDNVCDAALVCYIYVPVDESYTKPNGNTVKGEFIQCFDTRVANMLQRQYKAQLAAAEAAYEEGVNTAYD